MQQSNKRLSTISRLLVTLMFLGIGFTFFVFRQRIIDQIIVWQYNPTPEISSFVTRSGMNDNGKFYYFASEPQLKPTKNVGEVCEKTESTISILGCYVNYKIYISDVVDPKLDGIREVTASHETLHAIYSRMNNDEKSRIDKLVESEYQKLKSDKDFSDLISYYDKAEPGQRNNELHSLIGTQVASISRELELHYKQYFNDRQKVVVLNAKYSSVFLKLENRRKELKVQIKDLKNRIDLQKIQYDSDSSKLNSDISIFKSRAASNYYSSVSQFNYDQSALISRSTNLEIMRKEINNSIASYNSLYNEYSSIVSQYVDLYSSINTTPAPAPSL